MRVGGNAAVAPLPTAQGFLGIATELSTVTALSGPASDPDVPFIHLLRNLSPGAPLLLRLGGNSADNSWWPVPGMKEPRWITPLTPRWAADVKALLSATGARALMGVDMKLNSVRVAQAEVRAFDRYVGANLIDAFELGNEPEFYPLDVSNGGGHGHFTFPGYGRRFSKFAAAVGDVPIAGPGSGSPHWLPSMGQILNHMPVRLKLVTVHAYPLKDCSRGARNTVLDFFTHASIQGLAAFLHRTARQAAVHGKPLRVDEMNGIPCGGEAGLSNSFGEALWALNMLPALWRAGVQGVNFQTVDGNLNQMIKARHSAGGWSVSVEPEYYGLLAFADAAPAGSHLLSTSNPGLAHFYEFAVRAPDGSERVVLTNVGSKVRTLTVTASAVSGAGSVSFLRASSLHATHGTTLAGQSLSARTGQLAGAPHQTAVQPGAGGEYTVRVPAHAAAILTLPSASALQPAAFLRAPEPAAR